MLKRRAVKGASTILRTYATRSNSSRTTSKRTTATATSSPADPRRQTLRRIFLTGAVALITITGAITGARLKVDKDTSRAHRELQETPIEERMAILENRRAALVAMKAPVEKKLEGLRVRMRANKEQEVKVDEREQS